MSGRNIRADVPKHEVKKKRETNMFVASFLLVSQVFPVICHITSVFTFLLEIAEHLEHA